VGAPYEHPLKGKLKSLTRTSDYITVLCTHTPMQCFQNVLAYPATDLGHARKMFIQLAINLL